MVEFCAILKYFLENTLNRYLIYHMGAGSTESLSWVQNLLLNSAITTYDPG